MQSWAAALIAASYMGMGKGMGMGLHAVQVIWRATATWNTRSAANSPALGPSKSHPNRTTRPATQEAQKFLRFAKGSQQNDIG